MKPLFIALALSRALDVTSTCAGLDRGAVELHPLLPASCKGQVAVHAGLAVLQVVALHKLQRTHPTLARALAATAIGVELGATAHNMHIIWRLR